MEAGFSCVGQQLDAFWDAGFMMLGYMTSFLGAFVALTTMTYARQSLQRNSSRAYVFFLSSAGVSLGGSAIWTMHFLGFEALQLRDCNGALVETQFNALLTAISLFAAIICTSLAMHAVMPTRADLDRGNLSFIIKIHRLEIPIEKFGIKRWVGSSFFLMLAACIMHYMGMAAQYGQYTMVYGAGIIFASFVVAIVAASAGLLMVIQIAAVGDVGSMGLRLAASAVIGLAVNAMHYTGMQSATYTYTGTEEKALTYGVGMAFQVDSLFVCIISLVTDVVQLSICQYTQARLYTSLSNDWAQQRKQDLEVASGGRRKVRLELSLDKKTRSGILPKVMQAIKAQFQVNDRPNALEWYCDVSVVGNKVGQSFKILVNGAVIADLNAQQNSLGIVQSLQVAGAVQTEEAKLNEAVNI